MTSRKRLQFTTTIGAPVATVWRLMLDPQSYRLWTSAFAEGSRFEGSWERGARIRFLDPAGNGIVSEIAENRRHDFISIRHLGFIADGVEDMASEAVRAWAPAYENYTFSSTPEGTRLVVDLDVTEEWESMMNDSWPRALATLKQMCEAEGAA